MPTLTTDARGTNRITLPLIGGLLLTALIGLSLIPDGRQAVAPADREEVVFWHFWGGQDRRIVEDVVERFNRSQDRYFVRALAMPGNNLDLKLFLAVTGGSPPDLINQDDPIVADWASRGALTPIDEIATAEEISALSEYLVPAARRLGSYDDRTYAVCNGLDVRALYYNETILEQHGLAPPATIEELDQIAEATTSKNADGRIERMGYLPDPRRLWAWGTVFGGSFYNTANDRVTLDEPRVLAAMQWMTSYRERYGSATLAGFRQDDQSLPGKTFPLLAGRYTMIMDGQWRVRDIAAAQQRQRDNGESVTRYGVCPLPPPKGGRQQAGWANGNFFVVPHGAPRPAGAWEFMKFWVGFGGSEEQAAKTCVAGGWIPVSRSVTNHPTYQEFLQQQPLMKAFVDLSQSPWQVPTPVIPGAPFFQREVNATVEAAMFRQNVPSDAELLGKTNQRIQEHLDRLRNHAP